MYIYIYMCIYIYIYMTPLKMEVPTVRRASLSQLSGAKPSWIWLIAVRGCGLVIAKRRLHSKAYMGNSPLECIISTKYCVAMV